MPKRRPKPDFSKSMEEAERAAEDAVASVSEPADTFLGGSEEEETQRFEAAAEAEEAARKGDGPEPESEVDQLRREKEALERQLAEQRSREQAWREGKIENLDPDHPCEVTIQTGGPTDVNPVPVTHRGNEYLIPRGVPTRVPAKVVSILQDAKVQREESQVIDNQIVTVVRNHQRYPFTVHPLPAA